MNRLFIIGNLVKDPELRSTSSGISVCTFSIAVNSRKRQDGHQDVTYFRVSAWRELGENCAKWLIKGRKVCVIGPVSVSTYTGQDGKTYANLEVTAQDVEFCSQLGQDQAPAQEPAPQIDQQSGMQQVAMDDGELLF